MGSSDSKQEEKNIVKAKNKRQIEMLYHMFDETVSMMKDYRIRLSSYNKNQEESLVKTKISNLSEVIEQLLESFRQNQKYPWSKDIYKQFKSHFTRCFQELWSTNKEDFYKIILAQCKFQTIDFADELNEIANNKQQARPDRNSYQKFFYEVGANKLEQHLPSSKILSSDCFEDQIIKNNEDHDQFNVNAINATILNHDFDPKQYMQSCRQQQQNSDAQFIPLFINLKASRTSLADMLPNKVPVPQSKTAKQKIREARIQNSSLIAPQTIFVNRLSSTVKKQIADLVKFYRQFGNALQMMFFSVSLISAPFKHFTYLLTQKMERKKINIKTKTGRHYPLSDIKFTEIHHLLYGESHQAFQFRHRRSINNNLLLEQIKDFSEAYTQFIWKYLELTEITELKLGRLITIDALYGIVLKSVWSFVEFVSQRGFEYEQRNMEQYYLNAQQTNYSKISEDKKRYLLRLLKTLKGEKSPQKYLKKIVIFYRQVSILGECADDLLNIYQELLIRLIKERATRQLGLLRMKNIIEKVLKIDESYSGGGEIGYSWTTWCIIIQLLQSRLSQKDPNLKKNFSKNSNFYTEPDVQYYYEEQC